MIDEVEREGLIGRRTAIYLKNGDYIVGNMLIVRDQWVAIEDDKGERIFQHEQIQMVCIGVDTDE